MTALSTVPVGITLGDAAGIGPEIILRAMAEESDPELRVVYGSAKLLKLTRAHLMSFGLGPLPEIASVRLGKWRAARDGGLPLSPDAGMHVVDVTGELPKRARKTIKKLKVIPFGEHLPAFAHMQLVALEAAIADAQCGRISAICTAPLNKALFAEVGLPVTGHTEILADRTETSDHVMMLAGETLRVALVTTHLPLEQVAAHLSVDRILATMRTTARDLRRLYGITNPRLAVAALNPHAGERGNMGRQELEIIEPAVERARGEGMHVVGPLPADTLFAALGAEGPWPHDAVVCMYHDQALIPLKLVEFGRSANVTLGLPIVRTSVDHGTAYDIAGRGLADIGSLQYAVATAAAMGARTAKG